MDKPLVGDVIAGKYRIEGVAGEGGMGIVYEAEHILLRQRVAVKVLLPDAVASAEGVEPFSLEARAGANITSEHVVRVMDAGHLAGGAPYLVMEYLDGADLAAVLAARGPLPAAEVVDYALQVLEGLSHAHSLGIVHRDLKPANLFLCRTPTGRSILKMVDFGISNVRELREITTDAETLTGPRVLGSPMYMSPEQLRNLDLDARSDLWALGVVMYELLSGATPFAGAAIPQLIVAIISADIVPVHVRQNSVPEGLSDIVARCMTRDRAERWHDAAELAKAIAPFGTGAWTDLVPTIADVVARPEQARVTRMPEGPPPSSGDVKPALRILLIDDSELILAIHDRLLSDAGFEVRTTLSVGEFEAVLDRWKPHLVLMDVQMPDVSGDVLCRRIKARLGMQVPIVLYSSLALDVLEQHARTSGADAFLAKTGDGEMFVDYVRNICAITYSPDALPEP